MLTGCGWVTPFAHGSIADVLTAAAKPHDRPQPTETCWTVPDRFAAEQSNLPVEAKKNKGAWMTAIALEHARQDASLDQHAPAAERIGLVLGCALAGQQGMIGFAEEVREQSARFVSPLHFPQTVGNYVAGAMARGFQLRGPNVTVASGPASGLDAMVEACALLASDQADAVFAGGTEQLTTGLAEALAGPGELLSEGACWFALERAGDAASRGAKPLAIIIRCDRVRPDDESGAADGKMIMSTTARPMSGAIFIEHWVGRSLGVCGPAAVAAAIGAIQGLEVPVAGVSDGGFVSPKRFALDKLTSSQGMIRSCVIADADGPHRTIVELLIPPRSELRA